MYGIAAGIPDKIRMDTIEFEFNNLEHVEKLLKENKDEIAAILILLVEMKWKCQNQAT